MEIETLSTHENANAGHALLAWNEGPAMSWPLLPIAARVKKSGWPAVWLPVIVLWPLFIAVLCLAVPLSALLPAPRRAVIAALIATYQTLCALHGTQVEVTDPEHGTWNISLY